MHGKRILFYYLSAFRYTGGIEKFNRCFIKALNDLAVQGQTASIVSVYDEICDSRYNDRLPFLGFGKRRGPSLWYILRQAWKYDIFILGHINLAIAGVIIKLINPRCRLIVIVHGIEGWKKLRFSKKQVLKQADLVLAVSNYTRNQLVLRNGISPAKIKLFPNTIDPFFSIPREFTKPLYLMDRYQIKQGQPVILTLSRLLKSERFKGYDLVISSLPALLDKLPDLRYILAGKYDAAEKSRIESLVRSYGLENRVILTGFISDAEVPDHYRLADVFILPSRKEGFGIVFLEALACGTNVIGGNQDGTVDALHNGSLGKLINPGKKEELVEAVTGQLNSGHQNPGLVQQKVLSQYHFSIYKNRLNAILS